MKISQKGIDLIKRYEGFRETPYLCPAKKRTIGYGHVIKKGEGIVRISKSAAEKLLLQDLEKAEKTVNHLVKRKLRQGQFDALVSIVFNWGVGNFARSTALKRLNKSTVEEELFSKERGVVRIGKYFSPGLYRRRQAELTRLWNVQV